MIAIPRPRPGPMLICLLACLASAEGHAQEAASEPAEPNWAVTCSGEAPARRCSLLHNLVANQEGGGEKRLLTVLIQPDETGTETLVLALPHGLFLPAGVSIGVDAAPAQALVIQTSDENGAYAETPISPEFLASLKTGSELRVTFQSAQKQEIAVPVSLTGFAPGYAKLESDAAQP